MSGSPEAFWLTPSDPGPCAGLAASAILDGLTHRVCWVCPSAKTRQLWPVVRADWGVYGPRMRLKNAFSLSLVSGVAFSFVGAFFRSHAPMLTETYVRSRGANCGGGRDR